MKALRMFGILRLIATTGFLGAIGGCATPARVFKGMKMAGRMGGNRVTAQNLTIHAVDAENGLLLIKGQVPGANGGTVLVKTAAKGA